MDGAWSLVGRDVERRAVEHGFGDPGVGGVVLAGEAGVGRTRLAREALRVLTVLGCRPEWLPAKLAPVVPFGAVGPARAVRDAPR